MECIYYSTLHAGVFFTEEGRHTQHTRGTQGQSGRGGGRGRRNRLVSSNQQSERERGRGGTSAPDISIEIERKGGKKGGGGRTPPPVRWAPPRCDVHLGVPDNELMCGGGMPKCPHFPLHCPAHWAWRKERREKGGGTSCLGFGAPLIYLSWTLGCGCGYWIGWGEEKRGSQTEIDRRNPIPTPPHKDPLKKKGKIFSPQKVSFPFPSRT